MSKKINVSHITTAFLFLLAAMSAKLQDKNLPFGPKVRFNQICSIGAMKEATISYDESFTRPDITFFTRKNVEIILCPGSSHLAIQD